MKAKVLVATHKPYNFPDDPLYQPIEVGAALRDIHTGYLHDDGGEHISDKNTSYSEMTALYYAWKNGLFEDMEYCGLVHYRRYFRGSLPFKGASILSQQDLTELMQDCDILVPKKRNYWIETIEKHYQNAHYSKDLKIAEEELLRLSPEYHEAFREVMKGTKLHLYNMFVMSPKHFDAYCGWIFPLLFAVEKRVNISGYDAYQRRIFGFLAERLFNVWVLYQMKTKGVHLKEHSVVNIEGENLLLKALGVLGRKLRKKM